MATTGRIAALDFSKVDPKTLDKEHGKKESVIPIAWETKLRSTVNGLAMRHNVAICLHPSKPVVFGAYVRTAK